MAPTVPKLFLRFGARVRNIVPHRRIPAAALGSCSKPACFHSYSKPILAAFLFSATFFFTSDRRNLYLALVENKSKGRIRGYSDVYYYSSSTA